MLQAVSLATGIGREAFSAKLRKDLDDNRMNGVVGTELVSETDQVRVWHLRVPQGKLCAFHRHVLTFFRTSHSYGSARVYFEDGTIRDEKHAPRQTRHVTILPGQYMLHALANTGTTELVFTTVEYKQGGNTPLPLEQGCRLRLYPQT